MPTVAIYAIDQDPRTTTTLGVYRYTQNLIATLAARGADPGFRVRLWVCDANAADFVPAALPPWMEVRCVRGTHGTGLKRLWADHVRAPALAAADRVDAVHVPKGWLPLIGLPGCRTIVTLHDTITQYYLRQHPEHGNARRWGYFDWLMRRSARLADRVMTPTQSSADGLIALVPAVATKLTIVATGGMVERPPSTRARTEDLLVIGSRVPHKATQETLVRLNDWAQRRARHVSVIVTGLNGHADLPALAPPSHLDVRFVGRVPQAELDRLMQTCRALVFLSDVEGFGLPLLEAYSFHMPVCYRNVSSMRELMQGAAGAWDGNGADTFARALDEVLAMTPADIARVRASLKQRYDFRASVEQILDVYRSALDGKRR